MISSSDNWLLAEELPIEDEPVEELPIEELPVALLDGAEELDGADELELPAEPEVPDRCFVCDPELGVPAEPVSDELCDQAKG